MKFNWVRFVMLWMIVILTFLLKHFYNENLPDDTVSIMVWIGIIVSLMGFGLCFECKDKN